MDLKILLFELRVKILQKMTQIPGCPSKSMCYETAPFRTVIRCPTKGWVGYGLTLSPHVRSTTVPATTFPCTHPPLSYLTCHRKLNPCWWAYTYIISTALYHQEKNETNKQKEKAMVRLTFLLRKLGLFDTTKIGLKFLFPSLVII